MSAGVSLRTLHCAEGTAACCFHPDGLILGTGGLGGSVKVWDVREVGLEPAKTCEGHSAAVNSLSFSENGYLLASGSQDSTVRIWDLRKMTCVQTLEGVYLTMNG